MPHREPDGPASAHRGVVVGVSRVRPHGSEIEMDDLETIGRAFTGAPSGGVGR